MNNMTKPAEGCKPEPTFIFANMNDLVQCMMRHQRLFYMVGVFLPVRVYRIEALDQSGDSFKVSVESEKAISEPFTRRDIYWDTKQGNCPDLFVQKV